jgi:hypothetical protein
MKCEAKLSQGVIDAESEVKRGQSDYWFLRFGNTASNLHLLTNLWIGLGDTV